MTTKTSRVPGPPIRTLTLAVLGVAVILVAVLFRWQFKVTVVVGESMLPTFKTGDVLLVDRRAYVAEQPRRGDLVVARYQGGLVVKRLVGLPGEEIEVKMGNLFINGSEEMEAHPLKQGSLSIAKGRLMDGYFATLGDNRSVPTALAIHPVVLKSDIIGKVVLSETLWHATRKEGG